MCLWVSEWQLLLHEHELGSSVFLSSKPLNYFGVKVIRFFSMEGIASAFRWSCAMVFLRKVFILFKVEKHLSDSAVAIGDENLKKPYGLTECVLGVVFHENLHESQCTTVNLESLKFIDQGQFCLQFGLVQSTIGFHSVFQCWIWRAERHWWGAWWKITSPMHASEWYHLPMTWYLIIYIINIRIKCSYLTM